MSVLAKLKGLFAPSPEKQKAADLYRVLVNHARIPAFYLPPAEVPDTLDGRFELIVLHLFLLDERLKHLPETIAGYSRETLREELTTLFVDDMDRNLREMGVTDTGVGKRVRRMGAALVGRSRAYFEAGDSEELLKAALRRNLFGTVTEVEDSRIEAMHHYMKEARQHLASLSADTIIAAGHLFPVPDFK
jgi:cytochrome b pre-mRNA-processing protein 3